MTPSKTAWRHCTNCKADDHQAHSRSCPTFKHECKKLNARQPENLHRFFGDSLLDLSPQSHPGGRCSGFQAPAVTELGGQCQTTLAGFVGISRRRPWHERMAQPSPPGAPMRPPRTPILLSSADDFPSWSPSRPMSLSTVSESTVRALPPPFTTST
jgi:hypothetical protein